MSKCYVGLMGGIGNQLFQVAAGYAYSKDNQAELYLDSSKWSGGQGKNGYDYKNSIFKNFEYGTPLTRDVIGYHEPEYNYRPIPFDYENISLHGYFQSLKYFKHHQDDFKSELVLPRVSSNFLIDKNVAFHIRRGDYLNYPDIHYICNTAYFDKCFDMFGGYQINVFTDSPEYIIKEFNHRHFNLIQTTSELVDLTLMSIHDNVVCSNSTFSWWASFLGKEKERVIVPSKWFANGKEHEDIYREEMIKIDV